MKCIIASSSLGHQMCIDHRRGCVWSSNSSDFGVERHSSLVCKLGTETGKGTKSIELEEALVMIVSVSAFEETCQRFFIVNLYECYLCQFWHIVIFFIVNSIVLFLKHFHLVKRVSKFYIRKKRNPRVRTFSFLFDGSQTRKHCLVVLFMKVWCWIVHQRALDPKAY